MHSTLHYSSQDVFLKIFCFLCTSWRKIYPVNPFQRLCLHDLVFRLLEFLSGPRGPSPVTPEPHRFRIAPSVGVISDLLFLLLTIGTRSPRHSRVLCLLRRPVVSSPLPSTDLPKLILLRTTESLQTRSETYETLVTLRPLQLPPSLFLVFQWPFDLIPQSTICLPPLLSTRPRPL